MHTNTPATHPLPSPSTSSPKTWNSPPDWLRNLDPLSWVTSFLPEWDWWRWLPDFNLPWLQYLVPVAVAILIAGGEVERRKKRAERERQSDTTDNDDAHG